jgi:hypothetical protein
MTTVALGSFATRGLVTGVQLAEVGCQEKRPMVASRAVGMVEREAAMAPLHGWFAIALHSGGRWGQTSSPNATYLCATDALPILSP